MNIYLVERPVDDVSYDEYDSAVIVASDESEALEIARNTLSGGGWVNNYSSSWDEGTVTKIGVALAETPGIIHTSFNAG